MKCIRLVEVETGRERIERVSNEAAHKAVKDGRAEYVPKHLYKEYKKTGEVK